MFLVVILKQVLFWNGTIPKNGIFVGEFMDSCSILEKSFYSWWNCPMFYATWKLFNIDFIGWEVFGKGFLNRECRLIRRGFGWIGFFQAALLQGAIVGAFFSRRLAHWHEGKNNLRRKKMSSQAWRLMCALTKPLVICV